MRTLIEWKGQTDVIRPSVSLILAETIQPLDGQG